MEHAIFGQAQSLPRISPAAAIQYRDHMEELRKQVDQELSGHPEILSLLGRSPLEVMLTNHKNHVRFMATVFRLNTFNLLPRTVAWVYHAYHHHAFSYDYFPIELAAWKKAVSETLDPEAAVQINRIYDWLIDHHADFVELAESGAYSAGLQPLESQDKMQNFLRCMLENHYRECIEFAVESIHSAEELGRFYAEVITPALYEIGRLWEEGKISAVQEHLATAISMRIMSAMYGSFVMGDPTKGTAIVTAAPNEFHEVGARMVSDQLEMDGWQVEYLGANSPTVDLLELLRQKKPFFLGMAAVLPFNIEGIRCIIESMKADEELKQIKVMVGGPFFSHEPELWRQIGADGCAKDGVQAVALAGKWWAQEANQ